MAEKEVSDSCLLVSEEKSEGLYPMYFGVSCAFFALKMLSKLEMGDEDWSLAEDKMLQGSAQLLGLLFWRIQRGEVDGEKIEILRKLEVAEREIEELKRMRREDAKANEKVVSIFAAQEQNWLVERKKLRQQIGALMNELRVFEKKKQEEISELNAKLQDKELLIQSKVKLLEVGEEKRRELEKKIEEVERIAEDLRETAKREAKEHTSEILRHKTAFIELVSTQRQLEAEMGRALRQLEAAKQELGAAFEQKEESVAMVQKLSMEIVKMRKDLDQKDKILSAMLRKSKLDTTEKQMPLKEVKLSKSKKKQDEFESEKWRTISESRHERRSLRSIMSKQPTSRSEDFTGLRGVHALRMGSSQSGRSRSQQTNLHLDYVQPEIRKDSDIFSPLSAQYSPDNNDDLVIKANMRQLEGWVVAEAEKYINIIKQRHQLEIDAFVEQMRLKDEKLEAYSWRFLSAELETKRLRSHVEELNQDFLHIREDNMNLKSLVLDREAEIRSLKEKISLRLDLPRSQKIVLNLSACDPKLARSHSWSEVKIIKRMAGEKLQDPKTGMDLISEDAEAEKEGETQFPDQPPETFLTAQSPENDSDEVKEVVMDSGNAKGGPASPDEIEMVEKLASDRKSSSSKISTLPWKMDIHALGVSYKIKRLKQQLLMLERLMGKRGSNEENSSNNQGQFLINDFLLLMQLLNKQVNRYQSFQGKTDDLYKRMHENDQELGQGGAKIARTKEETRMLELFLEETFQLQRYIVATGQKLMEIQSKIASGFVGAAEGLLDGSASFDIKRFADGIRSLFREIQRGLEVRIARLIGDLEGTLACEGIIHMKK
ncbi:hypothetical protein RJ641_033706 [Dillenia turbinata]|uniref:Uncharacterized protein n=1 Tax=Dillenia turbinata TaxID=194707 RepID=A0AAN8ZG13_9MAGN